MNLEKRKKDDMFATAAHEVGHALITLHHRAPYSTIIMRMAEGHNSPAFPDEKTFIRGFNMPPERQQAQRLEVAADGYAGFIAEGKLLSNDTVTADELWELINSQGFPWSPEDRNIVGQVSEVLRREAFELAFAFLSKEVRNLRAYALWIYEDFLNNECEERHYLISSVIFVPPVPTTVRG